MVVLAIDGDGTRQTSLLPVIIWALTVPQALDARSLLITYDNSIYDANVSEELVDAMINRQENIS